eukprot:CAMPEP_0117658824 /NCGR_PEP_ID=MMETSP0804-20121206/6077_1 /TAXON_ID=1074897 /ORGANISM="Tetraselmis astigmatica, Strain CCMP880" /LENGTH=232 /DNA_ID=CAMNT_0005465385 /DNA_START=306 /DNA_END=1005 /DNA_ORIENTATION=+
MFLCSTLPGLLQVDVLQEVVQAFVKRSGQFFDVRLMNLFTLPIGFDNEDFLAEAEVPSKLFYWEASSLVAMTSSTSPLLREYWELMVVRCLAAEAVKHHLKKTETLYDSLYKQEAPEWLHGARSRDFTHRSTFRPEQKLQPMVVHMARWFWGALSILPPKGVRHRASIPANVRVKADMVDISVGKEVEACHPEASRMSISGETAAVEKKVEDVDIDGAPRVGPASELELQSV